VPAPPSRISAPKLRSLFRQVRQRLGEYLADAKPLPPKAARVDRFLFGLVQPVISARFVARDRELLKAALLPVVVVAAFCALAALPGRHDSAWHFVRRFYAAFAVLAPLPSIIFARHYARLAATARRKLGLGDCEPRLETLRRAIRRAIYQAILVAVGAIPVIGLLRLIPFFGGPARLAAALWALHWVIIGAFDDARECGACWCGRHVSSTRDSASVLIDQLVPAVPGSSCWKVSGYNAAARSCRVSNAEASCAACSFKGC